MNWFLIALGAPILWALVNHADKYLLSKYFRGQNVGALIIFSTLSAALILPILYVIESDVFGVSWSSISILIISGILSAVAVMFYIYALNSDETTVVVPLFQLIPIFSFFLGYVFLGESLVLFQVLGSLAIIIGSLLISIDFENKFRLKRKVLGLMIASSFVFALYETMFKLVAVEEGFVVSSFWEYIGLLLVGATLLIFVGSYRRQFVQMISLRPVFMVSYNSISEILTTIGNLLTNLALLSAPIVLVMSVANLQPLFVFIFGIIITVFFPQLGKEKFGKSVLLQKVIAIAIIVTGSFFLY